MNAMNKYEQSNVRSLASLFDNNKPWVADNKVLGKYINGNYNVTIYEDGTKIRETDDDEFKPSFPECIDMNITYKCDGHCPYCYINGDVNNDHCDFNKYTAILDSIHPFTELAINGNDLTHPDLFKLLNRMKDRQVIVNMTVNQRHFEQNFDLLSDLTNKGLIKGLGVSLTTTTPDFINKVLEFDNLVIHVINGVTYANDIFELMNKGIKILILGYKMVGRGINYYHHEESTIRMLQEYLKSNLPAILSGFDVVSFDNLALKQLNIKHFLTKDDFDKIYMGDDGEFTFYIDLVKGIYSKSSLDIEKVKFKIKDDDTVDTMFDTIRGLRL